LRSFAPKAELVDCDGQHIHFIPAAMSKIMLRGVKFPLISFTIRVRLAGCGVSHY
jgi:hypothetical protein